jgi:hypothetical protein
MKHIDAKVGLRCALGLVLAGSLTAYAAKGDKNPDSDKRIEKIERKLERAGAAEALAAAIAERKAMAATAPAPESGRGDRGDRSSGSSSRSRSSRGEYREPTTPADAKYDSFRLIVDRNIFNPSRRPRERTEERQQRIDMIALVGTMQSDKGVVAFFDSQDSAYRKTLSEGQSLGEFKVQKIQPNEVELARDGKPMSLRVSDQLRRPEGGDWSLAPSDIPTADTRGASAAAARPVEAPSINSETSDVARRMMEARQKQLKQ